MKLKVYSQSHCKYCDNIKKTLTENKIDFEEVEIDDHRDEWNELTRLIGVGMTPTIKIGEEVWVPSRDFRGPEELIKRLEYVKEFPLPIASEEDKIEMILNATKNLAMSLNNMNMQFSNVHQKVNQLTNPPPPPVKKEVKEETTTN